MKNSYYILTNLLTENEIRIITSIVNHIESNSGRIGIQSVAKENFVSVSLIMKLCKKLGFDGYSELFYHLSQQTNKFSYEPHMETIQSLVDNYNEETIKTFCSYLRLFREKKLFAVGAGFADPIANYFVQRLAICGFMVFNQVHFYDLMMFSGFAKDPVHTNVEPSLIFAISQSGESEEVLSDVNCAVQRGFKVISFTRKINSTLAKLSDICFLVDESKQTLISNIPNQFFGKVILVFEELLSMHLLNHELLES